jgi:hypothetical protein
MSATKLHTTKSGDGKTMHDSGMGSLGSESDSSPVQKSSPLGVNESCQHTEHPVNHGEQGSSVTKTFKVEFLGQLPLNKRHTQAMVPWILSEMQRKTLPISINFEVSTSALRGVGEDGIVFEHPPSTASRFSKSQQYPVCFGYVTRNHSRAAYTLLGFVAVNEAMVSSFYGQI